MQMVETAMQKECELKSHSTVECFRCHEPGHIAKHCQISPQCFKCGKNGHVGRQCRLGNRQQGSLGSRGPPAVKETA